MPRGEPAFPSWSASCRPRKGRPLSTTWLGPASAGQHRVRTRQAAGRRPRWLRRKRWRHLATARWAQRSHSGRAEWRPRQEGESIAGSSCDAPGTVRAAKKTNDSGGAPTWRCVELSQSTVNARRVLEPEADRFCGVLSDEFRRSWQSSDARGVRGVAQVVAQVGSKWRKSWGTGARKGRAGGCAREGATSFGRFGGEVPSRSNAGDVTAWTNRA